MKKNTRLAVLESGSYSYTVAQRLFPGAGFAECTDNLLVAMEVERGSCQAGIIAMGNSTLGPVAESNSILTQWPVLWPNRPLGIALEVKPLIVHSLITQPGVDLGSVKVVCGHPNALGQVRGWLYKNLPADVKFQTSPNTSRALDMVAADRVCAAIAGSKPAKNRGLQVLAEGIQSEDNRTRFILFGPGLQPPSLTDYRVTGHSATFIADLVNETGSLNSLTSQLLGALFNLKGLSYASHPNKPGELLFWADVELPGEDLEAEDLALRECLRRVRAEKVANQVCYLGHYPTIEI